MHLYLSWTLAQISHMFEVPPHHIQTTYVMQLLTRFPFKSFLRINGWNSTWHYQVK